MKKLIPFVLVAALMLSLSACGKKDNESNMSSGGMMSKIEDNTSSFIDSAESEISSITNSITN